MSDHYEHHRDDENEEFNHQRSSNGDFFDAPDWLRWMMAFINRVGFPIFAFLLMSYMCFVALHKVQNSIDVNTLTLTAAVEKNTTALRDLRHVISRRIDD